MTINLQSLSITSVFNSIVNFFRSQENNSRWKDLTTGSEGSFLIRMLSNVFSAISYRIVAQSRENYLSTAALTSSNIGIAVNLGYSVSRGSNLKRKVYLTPTRRYTFPKLSVIGAYNTEYDIIVLPNDDGTDPVLEAGVPTVINTVVGKVREESFVTGTSEIKIFSLFTTGISDDYVLYLDSNEVPTTDKIKELKDDKYLVRTNPFSSVDIAYLNFPDATYKYGTGSEITIRYVELADMEVIPYTAEMFSYYGTLTNVGNISSFTPFTPSDRIKVDAPLGHEVQNLIRSKPDYAYRLQQEKVDVIDVNYKPLTPTYTLITYLKDDLTLLTDLEKENFKKVLTDENYFGTPLPDITAPRREVAHLKIQLKLFDKYRSTSDIDLDVSNIIDNFYNKALGVTFNVYDLERQLESLSYVKYARVSHTINSRVPNQNYQLGYILKKDDNYYMATKILGSSGDSRPDWNCFKDKNNPVVPKAIDIGLKTEDGTVVWETFKRLPGLDNVELTEWKPNGRYGIGDYVYDDEAAPGFMFKCVDIKKSSSPYQISVGYVELGDFIVDGGIVWVVKAYNESLPSRQPLTTYKLGDSVNVSGTAGNFSLECVSYTGTVSPDSSIEFENFSYPIVSTTTDTFTVSGDQEDYFKVGDYIQAEAPDSYSSFVVKGVTFNGTNTQIRVNGTVNLTTRGYTTLYTQERGTRDGQILWSLVKDIDEITYDWNTYMTFEHELEILV